MTKYRKLPVEIEARQFTTNNESMGSPVMDAIVQWIKSNDGEAFHDSTAIYVHTLEGSMRADVGDWIIRGVKGEFYPCKPDIFSATYETVERVYVTAAGYAILPFGEAIEALKAGHRVARAGWNGKGMFLFHVPGGSISHPMLPEDAETLPYIVMRTVSGAVVPWLASQTDILSSDWQILRTAGGSD